MSAVPTKARRWHWIPPPGAEVKATKALPIKVRVKFRSPGRASKHPLPYPLSHSTRQPPICIFHTIISVRAQRCAEAIEFMY